MYRLFVDLNLYIHKTWHVVSWDITQMLCIGNLLRSQDCCDGGILSSFDDIKKLLIYISKMYWYFLVLIIINKPN